MQYKEVRKQLRKMAYTEKPYSIYKVPGTIKGIRLLAAIVVVIFALCLIQQGAFFHAGKAVCYAAGFLLFGFLRGLFSLLLPFFIEFLYDKNFFAHQPVILAVMGVLFLFLMYRCYVQFLRDACYVSIFGYNRDGELVEYDDALAKFAPIQPFDTCISIRLHIEPETDLELMRRHKMIGRIIAECSRQGLRNGFICAGFTAANEGRHMKLFFYTESCREESTVSALKVMFERYAQLQIVADVMQDPSWSIYFERLQPDPYERQEIYNSNYLQYLENTNVDFEKQHKLLFRFKLKSIQQINVLIHVLKEMGYEVAKEFPANLVWEDGSIMLIVYQYGKIGQYRINMVSKQFVEMASRYNAEFCDWIVGGEHGNKL